MANKQVLGINAPKQKEGQFDKNDPFYGTINVKTETLVGTVVKRDANRSATIEWGRAVLVQKYERQEARRSRIRVHNPASIDAQIGDKVLVARTRPISKTKHHVIIKIIGDDTPVVSNKTK
jgi:small subunit ribosomal protein S17